MEPCGEVRKVIVKRTRRNFISNSLVAALGVGVLGWSVIEQTTPDPNAENDWASRRVTPKGIIGLMIGLGFINSGLNGVIHGSPVRNSELGILNTSYNADPNLDLGTSQVSNDSRSAILGSGQTRPT